MQDIEDVEDIEDIEDIEYIPTCQHVNMSTCVKMCEDDHM
jgi:hypothetical protein